jgi:hypothetical protein
MEVAKLIVDLLGAIVWPVTVLIIILIFRKQINSRLKDVKEVELPGGFKAKLNKAKIEALKDEVSEELKKIETETVSKEKKEEERQEYISNLIQRFTDNNVEIVHDVIAENIEDNTLLVFTANESRNENIKYKIYYNPVSRNHRLPFNYIGLYADKTVFAIGKLTKSIACDYENGELIATNGESISILNKDEYDAIKEIILNTNYYDIHEGNRFFLVEEFYDTSFRKISHSSLRGKKYFWLNEIEGFQKHMSTSQIAKLLDGKVWE